MDEVVSHAARHALVSQYLTEVSLFAQELCPEAKVEATMERYEDEDGHVRLYPPPGLSQRHISDIEGKIAERCVDILIDTGIFLCVAVYEPDN